MRIRHMIKNRDVVPLFEVLRWCRAQRRNARETHPRHATYTLLIDTLEHLAHTKDIVEISTPKLEKLILKARTLAGWETARPRPIPTAPIPPDHRQCPTCRQVKPDKEFLQQATDRQREVYGWRTKRSVRWVRSPFCKQCRTNSLKRKRRQAKTLELRKNPHYRLMLQLREKRKTTIRHERDAYNPHARAFYATKSHALTHAIQTVEHLLDTSPTTPLPPASDWTLLLEENHRQTLLTAYQTLILQHLPGRSPSI